MTSGPTAGNIIAPWVALGFKFGVAVIDNKLYVLGGSDGLKTLNTMECSDPTGKI